MKKIITLLFSVAGLSLFAQPTITSSTDPVVGTSYVSVFLDSSTVVPGNAGANQTWDFSAAVPNGNMRTEDWLSVASTPFAASFPVASIAQKMTDTSGNVIYQYYNQSTSSAERTGVAFQSNGVQWVMVYTDPSMDRQFPMNYNNVLSDNFAASASVFVDPVTMTAYRYGTYSYLIDGWGTLITPEGTYTNTLRMKVHQYSTDSVVFSGAPLPAQVTHAISTSYFYGSANAGSKLYQFYIGYDTTITSSGTQVNISSSYQSTATGVTSVPHSKSHAVFPNPASDLISIHINEAMEGSSVITVFDLLGKIVMMKSVDIYSATDRMQVLPVADLEDGMYLVSVSSGDKKAVSKFVKSSK